jgi:hypothetical protein
MNSQDAALTRVAQAEQHIRKAADAWSAVDMRVIEACIQALETSASDLGAAFDMLQISPAGSGSAFRSNISSLKQGAARLERLVDASAAFLRSIPGLPVEDPGMYRPGGSVHYNAPALDTLGIQG